MVLPLYDDNSDLRIFPGVNYALIALNIFVFVVPQRLGAEDSWFTSAFATVPMEIKTGRDLVGDLPVRHPISGEVVGYIHHGATPVSVYLTLLTSMFMHGGVAHLLGNMLFLWIFGDNVEDYLGHVRYLFFYLAAGVFASLAHVGATYLFHHDPRIPSLGASGAISAVLGAYLLLFPEKRVTVILVRILTEVPAFVAIGMWFLFQIVNGVGALGDDMGGGVAYGAHIGGFAFGLGTIHLFAIGKEEEVDDLEHFE